MASSSSMTESYLIRLSIISRFFIYLLGLISYHFITPYDNSIYLNEPITILDTIISNMLKMYTHWDTVHFISIAKHGYVYEKQNAFFPFAPVLLNYCGYIVNSISFDYISYDYSMILGYFILSNLAFIGATIYLFRLTSNIINKKVAFYSSIIFILSPASIFLTACYTESFFAFFSFLGLYLYSENQLFYSSIAFAFTSTIRSNGILYAGFIVFNLLHQLPKLNTTNLFIVAMKAFLYCILVVAPFVAFQYHGYTLYCVENGINAIPPYCNSLFPSVYSHVQAKYWNVGLFNYYTMKQIPNFLLAAPVLLASVLAIYGYIKSNFKSFISIGFATPSPQLIYIYHFILLVGVCFTILHAQVSTRFLSSSAPLYWYLASIVEKRGTPILIWCLGFTLIGTILFTTFLPWT